jgi:hypothetical protein
MNLNQQLRIITNDLLKIPFIPPGPKPLWKSEVATSDIQVFMRHTPEIEAYLNHYYAYEDASGIHFYSSVEDCSVYIAESQGESNPQDWGSSIDVYDEVYPLFVNEYGAIRSELIQILGHPTYLNDNYQNDIINDKRADDWMRRDIPLERQMMDWICPIRLTYWVIENRVVYLTFHHIDKEEPLAIELGCRPNWVYVY